VRIFKASPVAIDDDSVTSLHVTAHILFSVNIRSRNYHSQLVFYCSIETSTESCRNVSEDKAS